MLKTKSLALIGTNHRGASASDGKLYIVIRTCWRVREFDASYEASLIEFDF